MARSACERRQPNYSKAVIGDRRLMADCSQSLSGDRNLDSGLRAIDEDPGSIFEFDHDLAGSNSHHACNRFPPQHLGRASGFFVEIVLRMIQALRPRN